MNVCSNYKEIRGVSRRVAKFLLESILIAFDFIWKLLPSDRNFATLLDPPLEIQLVESLFNSNFQTKMDENSNQRDYTVNLELPI